MRLYTIVQQEDKTDRLLRYYVLRFRFRHSYAKTNIKL